MELEKYPIPNSDAVIRHSPMAQFKQWSGQKQRKRPNETDFIPDNDGLSVNWEAKSSIEECFKNIGLKKKSDGVSYFSPSSYLMLKFQVDFLRSLKRNDDQFVEVEHNPISENLSHSLVIYYEDDEEIRVKMCDYIHENNTNIFKPPQHIESIVQNLREQLTTLK